MGSIEAYETTNGRRYRVRYRTPDRRQTDKRGFTRKRDAELFLANVEVSKARGEFIEASAQQATVSELGTAWMANQAHLKPSSLEPLRIAWRLYVEPQWGSTRVGAIRHSDVQAWVTQLTAGTAKSLHTFPGPRGDTTVKRCHGILAGILDAAVRDRRIASNPARGVDLPRKVKRPHPYLTHQQVDLVAREAKAHETLVLTLAYTGLRWGEATALRVQDVDMLRQRLKVARNAVRVGGRIILGTPKSHEARSVPFPSFLVDAIARSCAGKRPEQLVFGTGDAHLQQPTAKGGWYVAALRRARLVDESLPQPTVHDLRHTAASLAVSSGAHVKAVQRMLGHASAAMTLDTYADLFDDDLDAVAESLDVARSAAMVGRMWADGPTGPAPVAHIPRSEAG
jgi:integrase